MVVISLPRPLVRCLKTKDITGGLPRVAELFEARKPKEVAEIAKIDGKFLSAGTVRGKRKLIVTDRDRRELRSTLIPLGKHYLRSAR